MDEGTAAAPTEENREPTASRRHIIERPRLTKLLDEVEAKTILLVAPAGYGKTTLARQWLSEHGRRASWFRTKPASRDIAALALSVARASAAFVPGAGSTLAERLAATCDADSDADLLAELIIEDLGSWPAECWLAVDDYHLLITAPPAEAFFERIIQSGSVNLLVTSRIRPRWASARRVLYGEIREIGRSALAMTHDEASAVFRAGASLARLPGLLALADGWPAVIALAALGDDALPDLAEQVPEALHDYFADELFQELSPSTRAALCKLSFAPVIDDALVAVSIGPEGGRTVLEAERTGFLVRDGSALDLHPLLRSFLRGKLTDVERSDLELFGTRMLDEYVSRRLWDDAFDLIQSLGLGLQTERLLLEALEDLLAEGRLSTLSYWCERARQTAPASPIVRFAESELAFRRGKWRQAEIEALRVARSLSPNHPLASKAFFRAGQSAQLSDRIDEALVHLRRSESLAKSEEEARRSLWTQFLALVELERLDAAEAVLNRFVRGNPNNPVDVIRSHQALIHLAGRRGGLADALDAQSNVLELLDDVRDPMLRTSYLHTIGTSLLARAEYERALEIARRELEEAERGRLEFVRSHALTFQAGALLGLRKFADCRRSLAEARRLAASQDDLHAQMNSIVVQARLYLAESRIAQAIDLLSEDWGRKPSPGMYGDLLSTRALALACNGQITESRMHAELSERVTMHADARALRALAYVVGSEHERAAGGGDDGTSEKRLLEVIETGHVDCFVCAYRAHPPLLRILARSREVELRPLREAVELRDPPLAQKAGLISRRPQNSTEGSLSKREQEVLQLVAQGLSNKEIAKTLWITDSTAKVHVRNILAKLGVRSRTEAAVLSTQTNSQP